MVVRSLKGGCPVVAGVAGLATGSRDPPGSLEFADDSFESSGRYVSSLEVDVIDPLPSSQILISSQMVTSDAAGVQSG